MGTQIKKTSRRKHFSTDVLPIELQATVKRMLIENIWPDDFEGSRNGVPRYNSIVEYCKQKGFTVTKSSIGRFAQRIQTVSNQEIKRNARPYYLNCLADVCQDFATLQFDLSSADVSPDDMIHSVTDENRPRLERLREDYLQRIEKILADLKRLK